MSLDFYLVIFIYTLKQSSRSKREEVHCGGEILKTPAISPLYVISKYKSYIISKQATIVSKSKPTVGSIIQAKT